jgi:hypothetical protein
MAFGHSLQAMRYQESLFLHTPIAGSGVCVVTTFRLSDLVTGKGDSDCIIPPKLCRQGDMEGQAGIWDHLNLLRRLGFTHR